MMRVPEFLFEKVFEISFRQPEPFRATCGGKRAPYRPFSVGEVAVGKGFVLPDKGFVRRIPGDELPLVKAGRIIQQPDDMPGQNRARVAPARNPPGGMRSRGRQARAGAVPAC